MAELAAALLLTLVEPFVTLPARRLAPGLLLLSWLPAAGAACNEQGNGHIVAVSNHVA
jgi:hypothetical protein